MVQVLPFATLYVPLLPETMAMLPQAVAGLVFEAAVPTAFCPAGTAVLEQPARVSISAATIRVRAPRVFDVFIFSPIGEIPAVGLSDSLGVLALRFAAHRWTLVASSVELVRLRLRHKQENGR
jgi:hypothetical protein